MSIKYLTLIQPFYKSSGRNSNMPDTWLPFDGGHSCLNWFVKNRYKNDIDQSLHRFGSKKLKEISEFLVKIDVSSAQKVYNLYEVNNYLFSSPDIDYFKLANLIEEKITKNQKK